MKGREVDAEEAGREEVARVEAALEEAAKAEEVMVVGRVLAVKVTAE